MFNNQVIAGSSGQGGGFYDFPIEQSLRFNDDDNAYLSRTPSTGNQKTWTFSCWVKRGKVSGTDAQILTAYTSASDTTNIIFQSGGAIQWYDYISGYRVHLVTNALYRDVGSWYHLLFQLETSNATSGDRAKIYVNGERVTSFSTEVYPSLNADLKMNTAIEHRIGDTAQFAREFDGYMADVNFIDGQALDPTSFGEFKSGIWIPKDTAGLTFGTNGFRLQYADSAAIGDDTSGNTNDWTVNSLVASDVVLDSPTNSFATMNILDDNYASPKFSYSEGNLKYTYGYTGAGFDRVFGSIAISPNDTNKYYFEFTGNVTNEQMQWGVVSTDSLAYSVADRDNGLSATANASQLRWVSYLSAPYLYRIDSSTTSEGTLLTTSNGNAANGDIYSLVYDADAGKFYAWFNGVEFTGQNYAAGTSLWATMDTSKTYMVMMYQGDGGVTTKSGNMTANFGQASDFAGAKVRQGNTDANGLGDFYYPVPDGALALCTANLPQGAINTLADETPEDYFNTVTFTGTGSSNSVTGVGFEPSLSWFKNRSAAYSHQLVDQVRGKIGSDSSFARLASNLTNAEATPAGDDGLTSFDSDGFTVLGDESYNNSGQSIVAWNWKANGSGVSNTDGSITSTVSVGATSQQNWFSIVSYTGTGSNATVGHGLGVAPSMLLVKDRSATNNWQVFTETTGNTAALFLNLTSSVDSGETTYWNNTSPTSSVFSIGTNTKVNTSGRDYICYAFANAEGLCKVGSYTGNGSADGVFVYTGHRPALLLIKRTDASSDWIIQDNRRLGYNVDNNDLVPNQSYAEATDDRLDQLSNGFKLRSTFGTSNASGGTYIYLAIAEQPFKYANAR